MDKEGNNYYQTCRMCAGLTQNDAAERHGVSVSLLAKIETDQRVPSDDLVNKMAEVYKAPLLAWWHLKHHNPLGHFLPDVLTPNTDGDMAFQSILMEDDLEKANDLIKVLLADGVIDHQERKHLDTYADAIRNITNKGASINVYLSRILDGREPLR